MLKIPLSLYIHVPWCIKKCPYCDFNSHKRPDDMPEFDYIDCLLDDLQQELLWDERRELHSIFIGGGTPSLLQPDCYARLLDGISTIFDLAPGIEITMEANPGTVEQSRFRGYRQAGINRLSLGVQSFNDQALKALGRIHDATQALKAVDTLKSAGFDNFNLDLMYGLPNQTVEGAEQDLQVALASEPSHLSWYQLTLEPNTIFHKRPPTLPDESLIESMETMAYQQLQQAGLLRYEISAFAKEQRQCQHNLNYWTFGDYIGIGAGAHGKLTLVDGVWRHQKVRQPKAYLSSEQAYCSRRTRLNEDELRFEVMLNVSRLQQRTPLRLLSEHSGLPLSQFVPMLQQAHRQSLIELSEDYLQVTAHGRRYTNDLQSIFLP